MFCVGDKAISITHFLYFVTLRISCFVPSHKNMERNQSAFISYLWVFFSTKSICRFLFSYVLVCVVLLYCSFLASYITSPFNEILLNTRHNLLDCLLVSDL